MNAKITSQLVSGNTLQHGYGNVEETEYTRRLVRKFSSSTFEILYQCLLSSRMPYNEKLADRLREALAQIPKIKVEEKRMFRGLAFMVNGKMCVNVSGDDLMCRFDPSLKEELSERNGFRTMVMKGREYKGFGYVSEEGFKSKKDFDFWIDVCLSFNSKAKVSRKKKPSPKSAKLKLADTRNLVKKAAKKKKK